MRRHRDDFAHTQKVEIWALEILYKYYLNARVRGPEALRRGAGGSGIIFLEVPKFPLFVCARNRHDDDASRFPRLIHVAL